jgi:hypothetical protein
MSGNVNKPDKYFIMKINDIITEAEKPKKAAGTGRKSSDGVRYNSEVGLMAGFMRVDADSFNPAQPEKSLPAELLDDPERVYEEIKKFLAPNYDADIFSKWVGLGETYGYAMHDKLVKGSRRVKAFEWAGGTNQSSTGPSDVGFVGSDVSGVSIKEAGGITLANLTPASVNLKPENGDDVFAMYTLEGYLEMKRKIFTEVMNIAMEQPDVPLEPKEPAYSITYNSKTNKFRCVGKNVFEGTSAEILNSLRKNTGWQRPFGDWFVANFSAYRHFSDPLFQTISVKFVEVIRDALKDSTKLRKMLQFGAQPYFYATPKSLYYVPSFNEVEDLEVKDVTYGDPDGTSQLFKVLVGRKDALPEAVATLDVYIRYGNGMFEANPAVRVQNLKNAQYIAWEKLV